MESEPATECVSLIDCTSDGKISYGIVQPGSHLENGVPIVRVNNFDNGKLDLSSPIKVQPSIEAKHSRTRLVGGEVLLSLVGSTGQSAIAGPELAGWNVARAVAVIRPSAEYSATWIHICLQTPEVMHFLDSRANTTVQKTLNLKDVCEIPILRMPKARRDFIETCWTAVTDKIELNRRTNATLEGMAQALFKSWFVDFDPVIDNALAAGNPIPEELADRAEVRRAALADGTANREAAKPFPAAFQQTDELGWIPEGWEATPISKLLNTISETFPLKSVDEVVFLNTGDILNGRFLHDDLSLTTGLPGQAKKSIRKGDILYSEIRPKNRRFAYVYFDSPNHVVSTKLMVLRAIGNVNSLFAYLILKQEPIIEHLQMLAESRSGTFPQITFDVLSKVQTALPKDPKIVEVFTETILEPTYQKQLRNDASSDELTKLRDTLLPKLISGELRIPEAEKLAEGALA
ncbi:restriction endonuclease subunit S [Rubripirellula reticaptiva]|uniref:EcoKI restriction-modification system protein HsdS n=1 Tax=Rubripirellula reticaptiva TaxID=2528013 RepID=A0A5C6EM23_9BACT|nr:restriction endonuclease subunit S [Rubripirellula reticaptiva]TWU49440.1 EcoKI restriction-modification system protein HsdS [Rubripirellula reticaptiva]